VKKRPITLAIVSITAVIVLLLLFTVIGTVNSYSRVEVKAAAVQQDNKNVLDNTRKAIREAAAVSDKEVEALVSIITGYAEARGSNPDGGDNNAISMGMVTEAVPSITEVATLGRLQNIVVAGRKDWQAAQTRLIEIKRQGDEMIAVFPSNVVLGIFGKKPIEIQVVTSSETEKNFSTGEDETNWIGGEK
jgi:hypothetical protein